jgi:hypothetical protein
MSTGTTVYKKYMHTYDLTGTRNLHDICSYIHVHVLYIIHIIYVLSAGVIIALIKY